MHHTSLKVGKKNFECFWHRELTMKLLSCFSKLSHFRVYCIHGDQRKEGCSAVDLAAVVMFLFEFHLRFVYFQLFKAKNS